MTNSEPSWPRAAGWRVAALRGLDRVDGRDEALVALGGEQYVRIPLPSGRVPRAARPPRVG